jgi:hypothetical protein
MAKQPQLEKHYKQPTQLSFLQELELLKGFDRATQIEIITNKRLELLETLEPYKAYINEVLERISLLPQQVIIDGGGYPPSTYDIDTPIAPAEPEKPFKNLSLNELTALIGKGIPKDSFIVVDFEGVKAAVCKKENERTLQERGLTTLTPKELAGLWLSDTSKDTIINILKIKQTFGGYVDKVEAV